MEAYTRRHTHTNTHTHTHTHTYTLKLNDKPSGVDEIPPKLLFLNCIEQCGVPPATMYTLSLEGEMIHVEWKEVNVIPLFNNFRETGQITKDK